MCSSDLLISLSISETIAGLDGLRASNNSVTRGNPHGESTADASGVAIPVFGDNGEPIGSISVSGPTSRFENAARLNEIVKALEKVRRDLSPCSGQPVLRMIHSGKGEIQNDA